jgi:hypothetical protein
MSEIDDVLSKIRKLRALARSTSSPHEAETAMRSATALIERHRLHEAALEIDGAVPTANLPRWDDDPLLSGGAIAVWKERLIQHAAAHFGCIALRDRVEDPKRPGFRLQRMSLIGRPSDIDCVRELVALAIVQVEALARRNCHGQGRTYRASYCLGCARGLADSLEQARRQAREGASTTALVLLDERLEQARRSAPSGTIFRKVTRRVRNPGAYDRGREDGRTIDAARPQQRPLSEGEREGSASGR